MILEYHRPETLEGAIKILSRKTPKTFPLGGGTVLSHGMPGDYAVVDLQNLNLNRIEPNNHSIQIGATVTLQQLYEFPGLPVSLKDVIKREANQNIRNQGTLGGTIVCSDGKSTLVAALLALDSRLAWAPGDKKIGLGDWLSLRHNWSGGLLITCIELSLAPTLEFASVSRTPLDQPLIYVVAGKWPSGRTRIVVGGWGPAPILVLDGPNADGAEYAVQNACSQLPSPSQNLYITKTAKILTLRLFEAHS